MSPKPLVKAGTLGLLASCIVAVFVGSSLGASVSPSTSSAPSPAPVKANETLPNILPVAATTARTAVLNRTGAVSTSSLGTSTYCGYSDCGSNCDEYAASQSLATYGDWGWYSFSAVQSYTCTDGSYQYYCCIESCTSSYDCPGVYLCDASDHCHLPSASPPPPPVYSPQGYASPTSNAIVSTAQTGCEAGTCDCQCDKANLGSAVFVGTYPVAANETCHDYQCARAYPNECTYTVQAGCTELSMRKTWAASYWWVILLACIGGLVLVCCTGCIVSKAFRSHDMESLNTPRAGSNQRLFR